MIRQSFPIHRDWHDRLPLRLEFVDIISPLPRLAIMCAPVVVVGVAIDFV